MDYIKRANELREEMVTNRRFLHQHPEIGLELPETTRYVTEKLSEMGYDPKPAGPSGIVATVGSGGKVFLLRGDMDALAMKEESGEAFACTGENAHTCGHDMHAAILLGAAKMLKENESNLKGTVKLMFQPAEEIFKGAASMIEAGVLENPKVNAAFAIHMAPGALPQGMYLYNDSSTMMCSADLFKVKIQGKGAHGSYPNLSVDPINIAAHIVIALQEIIARETVPSNLCILTIGSIHSGAMANSIPDTAELMGSIRTNDKQMRELTVKRMKEICEQTASIFQGTATVEMISGTPPLICNSEHTKLMVKYINELDYAGKMGYPGMQANGSEDFAEIADRVPSCYMMLSAGFGDKDSAGFSSHHPKVRFNEDTLPIGAAIMAQCATRWLDSENPG